jgi:hypothetical protein
MCGPAVITGLSSYRLITSDDTTTTCGFKTFMKKFLKESLFSNFVRGMRIFIFIISCSLIKGVGCLFSSFKFITTCIDGCG